VDLNELKKLAQEDEIVDTAAQTITCPVCDGKRHQIIYTYEQLQIRECEGTHKGKHTLYFDHKGKVLFAVEHHDGTVDWQEAIDFQRTEGYDPNAQSWDHLGERRQRRKKNGHFNFYLEE
jgi:hypothetical protein